MKKILATLFLIPMLYVAHAQQNGPMASPAASVSTTVGMTEVTVNYFRPKMKGRKIFGELVPYGKIWRTGANGGTKISFSTDVTVEGTSVPKGEYLIFTWPTASEWTVSLYKDTSIGGYTDRYKKENEVANFKVKPIKLSDKVETFTVGIGDLTDDSTSANIIISWENTAVKFNVKVPKSW